MKKHLASIEAAVIDLKREVDSYRRHGNLSIEDEIKVRNMVQTIRDLQEDRDYLIKIRAQNSAYMLQQQQPTNIVVGDEIVRQVLSVDKKEGKNG